MPDTQLRHEVIRIASELPEGDETRRKLLAAVQGREAAYRNVEGLAADILRAINLRVSLSEDNIRPWVEKYVGDMGISVKMRDLLDDILYNAVKVGVNPRKLQKIIDQNTIPRS